MWRSIARVVSFGALALPACRHEGAASRATGSSASSSAVVSSSSVVSSSAIASPNATASPSAVASSNVSAGHATAEPQAVTHCAAFGKKGSHELKPIQEAELQLSAQGDELFALGFTHELARTRLYRFSRAGGAVTVVAEQKGLGERTPFAVAGGAAFFVQAGKLHKLGPEAGAAVQLYDGVHSPPVVVGSHVLAIACDTKQETDHLLQLPIAGGTADIIAELPRASHARCRYSSLVADERDLFIADWNGQRLLRVGLANKSVQTIASQVGFPGPLRLEPEGLLFISTAGLLRVGRAGGATTRLASAEIALGPYSELAGNGVDDWVFDNMPYSVRSTLFRIAKAGSAPKAFLTLRNNDPAATVIDGQGLLAFAVDDECVYIAQTQYHRAGAQIITRALTE
jgi:hypothetical protein